ncbi:MAG: NUDIX hydrolase N-terminal domain-containing protein [Akkermansia sp.]|nr:NUDIX hydrolase N-terminal domain-containing protein [Akkermansia sp.]
MYRHIIFNLDTSLAASRMPAPGERSLIQILAAHGVGLGALTRRPRREHETDFAPLGLDIYFGAIVCGDEVPDGRLLPACMERLGARPGGSLFIGSSLSDASRAAEAGAAFGLAAWCAGDSVLLADYRFERPSDLLAVLNPAPARDRYLDRIFELQMIAQAGLAYSRDPFDIDRFRRLRRMAAEMLGEEAGLSTETVSGLFCNEEGYPTPKLDSRAAVFDAAGRILLVRERSDGTWSLPGGWVDSNLSVAENLVKEVREEAGLDVVPGKFVALLDRNRHNVPPFAYGIAKAFMICEAAEGRFAPSLETDASGYFSLDSLPAPLSVNRNTKEQIALCFLARKDPHWQTLCE